MEGVWMAVRQLKEGRCEIENQYGRVVRANGNLPARDCMAEVFEVADRPWRGIGEIPASGLRLKPEYRRFDAEQRFKIDVGRVVEPPNCISGLVLQGIKKPYECPVFATGCTPERPLGAPMVPSEGACAAYCLYGRQQNN